MGRTFGSEELGVSSTGKTGDKKSGEKCRDAVLEMETASEDTYVKMFTSESIIGLASMKMF